MGVDDFKDCMTISSPATTTCRRTISGGAGGWRGGEKPRKARGGPRGRWILGAAKR